MKAVIMCGGRGTRLLPLTETRPKPLVKFLNIGILDRTLSVPGALSIGETHLALGFKAQEIVSHCEGRSYGTELFYHIETTPLGTAGGVKNCFFQTNEDLLVLSGDNVFDLDLDAAIRRHQNDRADLTIVGIEAEDPREYGVILRDDEENVTGFIEKPDWENALSSLVNTGIYIMRGALLDRIPSDRPFDFAGDLIPALIKDGFSVKCYSAKGYWGDVGEPDSLLTFSERLLAAAEPPTTNGTLILEDLRTPDGAVILAPSLIGIGSVLQKGAVVGPFAVVGAECEIGERAVLSHCILGDQVRLDADSEVCGAILDDGVRFGARAVAETGAVIGYGVQVGRFSRVMERCRIWPGNSVPPESIVNDDLFFGAAKTLEADLTGLEGTVFTELTLPDAIRIGQAAAAIPSVRRIGVSYSGAEAAVIYKDACVAGVRASGVISYDFDEIFFAQAYFYAAYCSLDLFVYIVADGQKISFSFLGKHGLPVDASTVRKINNNYRFSAFSYAQPEAVGDLFHMHLLSTAYVASLRKALEVRNADRAVRIECENPLIRSICDTFLPGTVLNGTGELPTLSLMIGREGTSLYALEDGKVFDVSSIRALLAEVALRDGERILLGEDAPVRIEETAGKLHKTVIRVCENGTGTAGSAAELLSSIWNFDALFLAAFLLRYLHEKHAKLGDVISRAEQVVVRKLDLPLGTEPGLIRGKIVSLGAKRRDPEDPYYRIEDARGRIRIRQLGNAAKIRVLVEATSAETAKELSGEIRDRLLSEEADAQSNSSNDLNSIY